MTSHPKRTRTAGAVPRPPRWLALPLLLAAPLSAQAVELTAGDWTIDIGGYINAFYTYTDCGDEPVGGLALAGQALGCGGTDRRSTIGNGLLPNALVTTFGSRQGDYDVGGTIAIMAHTATSSAIAPNSGVDVRQAFFTVGNDGMGSFKLGRDYGVFGSGAILGDMTLLGVGAPIQATQRGRVSLGHIGAGYTYLGHYGQMAYTSPDLGGVQVTAAVMSPVDNGGRFDSGAAPQVQAKLAWSNDRFTLWAAGKQQNFEAIDSNEADDFSMSGVELGASFTAGRFAGLVNVQTGKGLGILSDGDQEDTRSSNWLAQGTFDVTDQLKLGVNYGVSKNRDETPATGGLESNTNLTAGSYFKLTPSVTLVLELGRTRSDAFDGERVTMNGASFGGILFF